MYRVRIKEIRKTLGLSIAKMANKLDMSASTITNYERGERTPSIEFLLQMNIKLNVNANWFLTGKGEMFLTEQEFATQYENVKNDILKEVRKMLKEKGL